MGREFELKYRVSEEAFSAIRSAYGPFSSITMETTYYDDPEGSLGKCRWTLRRRYENGVSVCTVKTPADQGARGEWEAECGDILTAIPLLVEKGAPEQLLATARRGVVTVCGARFTRLAALLRAGDATVELALDRGHLLGGGEELPFAEVEVELKEGSEEAAAAFGAQLAARYGLIPEPRSKVQRALALAKR